MLGTFVLSEGYYDAYYSKAQTVRKLVHDKTLEIFNNYDFIITPTTPCTAFEIGENIKDPIKMYLQDIYTVQANIVGIPAISIPFKKDKQGLPYGIQLMAAKFNDFVLLKFSQRIYNILND